MHDPLRQIERRAEAASRPRRGSDPTLVAALHKPVRLAGAVIEQVGAGIGEDRRAAPPACRAATPSMALLASRVTGIEAGSMYSPCAPIRLRSPRRGARRGTASGFAPASSRACRRGAAQSPPPPRRISTSCRSASGAAGAVSRRAASHRIGPRIRDLSSDICLELRRRLVAAPLVEAEHGPALLHVRRQRRA